MGICCDVERQVLPNDQVEVAPPVASCCGVVQLVRTVDSYSTCRGFKSLLRNQPPSLIWRRMHLAIQDLKKALLIAENAVEACRENLRELELERNTVNDALTMNRIRIEQLESAIVQLGGKLLAGKKYGRAFAIGAKEPTVE